MSATKLAALQYHNQNGGRFNIDSQDEVRALVVWLEDFHIRFYKIEDRDALRNTESEDWQTVGFAAYLKDLKCPHAATDSIALVLDWLLGYAVRLSYGDNSDTLKDLTAAKVNEQRAEAEAKPKTANPIDNLDFGSAEFRDGVRSLARVLNIPMHPDHLVMLKAISKIVQERFSSQALESTTSIATPNKNTVAPLEKLPGAVEVDDPALHAAARILRLLHVQEMRELQTRVNETIVAVQKITANPRTDERLGKVGR